MEERLRIKGKNGCGPHLTATFWGKGSPPELQGRLEFHISGYNSENKFLDVEETQQMVNFIKGIDAGKT